jgi:hypothetical protein
MSKYICFTKLKHLIFLNRGSTTSVLNYKMLRSIILAYKSILYFWNGGSKYICKCVIETENLLKACFFSWAACSSYFLIKNHIICLAHADRSCLLKHACVCVYEANSTYQSECGFLELELHIAHFSKKYISKIMF